MYISKTKLSACVKCHKQQTLCESTLYFYMIFKFRLEKGLWNFHDNITNSHPLLYSKILKYFIDQYEFGWKNISQISIHDKNNNSNYYVPKKCPFITGQSVSIQSEQIRQRAVSYRSFCCAEHFQLAFIHFIQLFTL